MSDTTAFIAGCATTGVAVLVLLVSRVGQVSSQSSVDRAVSNAVELPAAVPVPSLPNPDPSTEWKDDLRSELDRQRELTSKLESQLMQQEMLARNLENQLKQQQDETRAVLSHLQDYQRSVDTMSLQNNQLLVESQRQSGGLKTALMWFGGALLAVVVLGGGGLLLCVVIMAIQARQRRQERTAPVMYHQHLNMPNVPSQAPSYGYYEQEFLPPPPVRQRRVQQYYDYDV